MKSLRGGLLCLLSFTLPGCADRVVGWGDHPNTAPTVTFVSPADGKTRIGLDELVVASFSEAMDPQTITEESFTLDADGSLVDGVVSYHGVTATFTPADALDPHTLYTATVFQDAADLRGLGLDEDYLWTFTTGAQPDKTPPTVTSTAPAALATGVLINRSVTATFSEAMDPASISGATFALDDDGTPIPGAVSYAGVTATFNPTDSLDTLTEYTATVFQEAMDLSGNPMVDDHVWTFTTGPVLDTTPPSVTFTVPADDATGVALSTSIAAVFSEPMDPATITGSSFTVQQLDTAIGGVVSYVNLTATFNPTSDLPPNTTFSATLTTEAQDLAGNSLDRNYVWNFKTGATPDTTRPLVVATIPAHLATGVVLDTNVTATFNEPMDPGTLTSATFTLMDGAVAIAGAVTQIGATAIFDPAVDLDPETEYTATVTDVAADLAGNTLLADYEWTFTTGLLVDVEAPTVILTNPFDQEAEVPLDASVNATFSEDMDPTTINTATFLVTGPGLTEVTGIVVYDVLGQIATFTPDNELLPETGYTATITFEATDLAGNEIEDDYVWNFSTGEGVFALAPIDLRSLGTFVAVAGSGLTNSNSSGVTTLNGDVGLSPTATCESDGSPCSLGAPQINGTLYAADPEGVAAQAKTDLVAAYVDGMARPPGTTVNDISGMTLIPGVYTSGSTMSIAVNGTVILDGQGDGNSVWIFQVGSSLTVNNGAKLLLINGAKAKHVFWAIGASSTLGSDVSFAGSVLAQESNSVGTDSVVVGRLLCTTGQITLLSNTVSLPFPPY